FGELDVVIADDLDPVSPGVVEIEEWARLGLDARVRKRLANRLLVVNDKAEVASVVARLLPPRLQCQELVAQIDERHAVVTAAQCEVEQAAIEGQSLANVSDLKRYVVEPNRARFLYLSHVRLRFVDDMGGGAQRS